MNEVSVLVVEDNESDMKVITGALRDAGIAFLAVKNSVEALEAIERFKPSIALLDLNMPELSGRALCKIIKSNPKTRHIEVIFLTASDRKEDVLFGVKMHAAYYVKGVSMAELIKGIRGIDFAVHLEDEIDEFQKLNLNLHNKYQQVCELH